MSNNIKMWSTQKRMYISKLYMPKKQQNFYKIKLTLKYSQEKNKKSYKTQTGYRLLTFFFKRSQHPLHTI